MYGMKSWRQPPWMWASRRRRVKRLETGILGKMRSEEAPSAKGGAEGRKLMYRGRARLVLDPKLASPVGGPWRGGERGARGNSWGAGRSFRGVRKVERGRGGLGNSAVCIRILSMAPSSSRNNRDKKKQRRRAQDGATRDSGGAEISEGIIVVFVWGRKRDTRRERHAERITISIICARRLRRRIAISSRVPLLQLWTNHEVEDQRDSASAERLGILDFRAPQWIPVGRIALSEGASLGNNNKSGNNNGAAALPSTPMPACSDPPTGLASPFKRLRRLGEPYKLHYHVRREGSPSPLNLMRSSTGMLHRLNHYKGTPRSPRLINLGIINEGFSPLGMSVDELAAGFSNISMRSASPVSPAERKPAFGETQSSREFNETTGERRTSALMGSGGPMWTSVRVDSGGLNRIPRRRRGRTSALMGSGVPMWKYVRMDSSEARPLNPRRWTSAPTGLAGLGSTFALMDSGAALGSTFSLMDSGVALVRLFKSKNAVTHYVSTVANILVTRVENRAKYRRVWNAPGSVHVIPSINATPPPRLFALLATGLDLQRYTFRPIPSLCAKAFLPKTRSSTAVIPMLSLGGNDDNGGRQESPSQPTPGGRGAELHVRSTPKGATLAELP
ncbi:hypothetical protein B0H16DRAFT_1479704 [Mycena metata]|uniref:Uncharacterized protein n=1 Tax=Mycena metata TaxID=1033252 RepID=A0AAD7H540_9AGAR|nr:hypothetical protein B0H16DRAFT_1479704 [Mycena metata]